MAQTIRRGQTQRRPTVNRRKAKPPSLWRRTLDKVPLSEATLHRIATWGFVGVVGVALVGTASFLGVPGAIGSAVGEGLGRAGLRVTNVQITGLQHMDQNEVYRIAFDQPSLAMPLVDLGAIRQRLLERGGWIADAHVSRRLPDTLVVHIVESEPAAVWQNNGRLALISNTGTLLEPVSADAIPDLPLVIGPHANEQESSYRTLLAAAPTLRPQVRAANWIGNRRWNLVFESGEVLQLPEGDEAAQRALARFARMDSGAPLLGRGWAGFDMRDASKLVARRPGTSATRAITDPARDEAPAGASHGATEARARVSEAGQA